MAHAIEGFKAPKCDEINQAIAGKTIEMILKWLPRAYADGSDIMPRMKMQQAAMMAGIPLANAGSGISHALGHTIGGLFYIHHGVLVLLFIPYELQVYARVTERYLKLCDLMGVRDHDSDEKRLSGLIEKIRNFMTSLRLPIGLKDAGVKMEGLEEHMDMILERTPTDPAFYFGWYDLNEDQLSDIFLHAYEGKLLDLHSKPWR